MEKVGDARQVVGREGEKEYTVPIFRGKEVERAEAIVNALDGLTIASANEFLDRVKVYLLTTRITI